MPTLMAVADIHVQIQRQLKSAGLPGNWNVLGWAAGLPPPTPAEQQQAQRQQLSRPAVCRVRTPSKVALGLVPVELVGGDSSIAMQP